MKKASLLIFGMLFLINDASLLYFIELNNELYTMKSLYDLNIGLRLSFTFLRVSMVLIY